MRYYLKEDKRKELQDGRTIVALAGIIGMSPEYLTGLINKGEFKKYLAMILISIKHNISITDEKMNDLLSYYFNIK